MRTILVLICISFLVFSFNGINIAAQQSPDLQKDIELLKKADKKLQYSLTRAVKDLKAENQKIEENLKNITLQEAVLKSNIDSLDNHISVLKAYINKKQDLMTSKMFNLSIRLWLCVLILLIIAAYIFFGVIGAIRKNKLTLETRLINDKEVTELALKKLEKEMNGKLLLIEQQLTALKK